LNVQNSEVHRGSTTISAQLFPIFDMFFSITPVQRQPLYS
jgi:hypothetical protein